MDEKQWVVEPFREFLPEIHPKLKPLAQVPIYLTEGTRYFACFNQRAFQAGETVGMRIDCAIQGFMVLYTFLNGTDDASESKGAHVFSNKGKGFKYGDPRIFQG